jgi:hypothetical protein
LNQYSLEQLQQTPSEGGWSLVQVYLHLAMSANKYFLQNADKCLNKTDLVTKGNISLPGQLIFLFGRTPNLRIKMPDKVAVNPEQPESKEQLIAELEGLKQRMRTTAAVLRKQFNPKDKRKHAIFGPMNAWQWYRLVAIHFMHHERQRKRLEGMIKPG